MKHASPFARLFCALALVPTLSLADSSRWTILPENPLTGITGAAICPYEDMTRGNHTCLTLECVPGAPLTLTASVAGFDQPETLSVAINVDGTPLWDLILYPQDDGRYAAGLSGHKWRAGLKDLQSGSSGTVTFTTRDYLWRDHLPLRGSRNAIDHALAACATATTDPTRDPARAAREEVTAYCHDRLNRAAVMNDGFTREEDVDGDGRKDVLVNYGAANCGAIGGAWCGWSGCERAVHLARGDGYIQGFRGIDEGFRIRNGDMILRRHASECPDLTDGPCAVRYRFTADGMTKAGVAEWPSD